MDMQVNSRDENITRVRMYTYMSTTYIYTIYIRYMYILLDHPMIDRSTIHKINIVRDYYPCRRESRFFSTDRSAQCSFILYAAAVLYDAMSQCHIIYYNIIFCYSISIEFAFWLRHRPHHCSNHRDTTRPRYMLYFNVNSVLPQ